MFVEYFNQSEMNKVNFYFLTYCPHRGKQSTRTVQVALGFKCFFTFGGGLLY